MKTKFLLFAFAIFSCALISCEKMQYEDDGNDNNNQFMLDDSGNSGVVTPPQSQSTSGSGSTSTSVFASDNDPDGTVWLYINYEDAPDSGVSSNRYRYYDLESNGRHFYLAWHFPNNIYAIYGKMARIGKITGLKDIDIYNLPTTGWADIMAAEPGYGYILYYSGYFALMVVDHIYSADSHGICGAVVKYCPFSESGWNQ